jgi:hypothetical protein
MRSSDHFMRSVGRLTRATGVRSLLVAVISLAGCLSPATVSSPQLIGEGRRILFIGNSLTYTNDLPGVLQALADSAGGDRLAVESVVAPDYDLELHWTDGIAQKEIAKGGWELVVLQQGPSSREENREHLRTWTKRFATEIARVSARPALFSVWPMQVNQTDFPRAIESYTLAAADVNGLLLPAAAAWLAAWTRDAMLALYSDGLHPNPTGTYLSALVMYAQIFQHSPVGLPRGVRTRSGATLVIDASTALLLQEVAAQVTEHVRS